MTIASGAVHGSKLGGNLMSKKVSAETNCEQLSKIVDMMAMKTLCLRYSLISVIISLYEDYCKKTIRY